MNFVREEHCLFKEILASEDVMRRIFGALFPETHIHSLESKAHQAAVYLENIICEHPDNRYSEEKKNQIGIDLDLILNDERKRGKRVSEKVQPNRVLHKLGYEIKRINKKAKDSPDYDCWEIVTWAHKEKN